MVQYLTLAIQAAADLLAKRPERYHALCLSAEETEHIKRLPGRKSLPYQTPLPDILPRTKPCICWNRLTL